MRYVINQDHLTLFNASLDNFKIFDAICNKLIILLTFQYCNFFRNNVSINYLRKNKLFFRLSYYIHLDSLTHYLNGYLKGRYKVIKANNALYMMQIRQLKRLIDLGCTNFYNAYYVIFSDYPSENYLIELIQAINMTNNKNVYDDILKILVDQYCNFKNKIN